MSSLFSRIDYFLHEGFAHEETRLYKIINDIIVFLIFFSILSIMIASVEEIYTKYQKIFDISENIVVGIFVFEYLANIYVAPRKSKYIFGAWGIIDFLAIAPSLVNFIDLRAIKVLRILRILRFLRLMRMLRLLKLAKRATKEYEESKASKTDTLKMDLQIYFIALFSVVVIFSTLMYYIERGIPNTLFTNIPKAMWWCIVTITTVGYGDMYPLTVLGKIVAAATMLCGLALFGLLMNVIGKSMMSSLFGSTNLDDQETQIREVGEALKKKR